MKYMVMECHPGYAVVMDNAGRFLKVANMHYEVGQTVSSVLEMNIPDASRKTKMIHLRKRWISAVSIAACLCIIVLGGWRFLMSPYGSVRMQINPDVQMTVNCLDYVIGLDGINDDGDVLIEDYSYRGKKVDLVSDELADRAVEMGYLKEGGIIHIIVESKHERWRTETEKRIVIELEEHIKGSITVTPNSSDASDERTSPDQNSIIIPIHPTQPFLDDDHENDNDDSDIEIDDEDDQDDDELDSDDFNQDDEPDGENDDIDTDVEDDADDEWE